MLIDFDRAEIINIEGKQDVNIDVGISELKNLEEIEKYFIRKHYPDYRIIRTVVLYGGDSIEVRRIEVCFLLNKRGKLVLGLRVPEVIREAINNLRDYWQVTH